MHARTNNTFDLPPAVKNGFPETARTPGLSMALKPGWSWNLNLGQRSSLNRAQCLNLNLGRGLSLGLVLLLGLLSWSGLAACPFAAPAMAAGPSGTGRTANGAQTNIGQNPSGRGRRYWLTVTVRNPRCPACLKTLKTYLLACNGVQEVSIADLKTVKDKIDIKVRLTGPARAPRMIERIKDHDLEILGTKPAGFGSIKEP